MGARAGWTRFVRPDVPTWDEGIQPLALAFEQSPVPMALVAPDLRFLNTNIALDRLFGRTPGELHSLALTDLVHPDDASSREEIRKFAGTETGFRLTCRCTSHTAGELWCVVSLTAVREEAGVLQCLLATFEDLTEQRRLADALRSARDFSARVLEGTTHAIATFDAERRFLEASACVAEITGYTTEELRGRAIDSLVPASERDRIGAHFNAALRGEGGSWFETVVVCKDGPARHVGARLLPLILENGQAGVLGLGEDITRRDHTEHALRSSEDRYRDLVENSGVLIGTHDLDGKILSANQSFVNIAGSGLRPEEVIGTGISDLLAPSVRHLFPAYLEKMRLEGHARGTMRIVTPGGEERILEYDNSLRHDGRTSPVVRCFAHDVTEQKRAARALRSSEARYRDLYEDNPAMYFTVDPAGTILSVNRFGAEQLGYSADELVNRSVLDVFHPDDRAGVLLQMAACVENVSQVAHWECRKVRKDGAVLWVRETARAVTCLDGGIAVLVVCDDITERRKTEEALRNSEARLRALSDNVPNGAVFQFARGSDGQARFLHMSAGIRQLVSVTAEDAMRDAGLVFDRLVEEDRPRIWASVEESMRLLSAIDLEVRFRASQDLIKWIHFRAAPRRCPDWGTLWDGVLVDVTEAHHDLEALLQAVGAIVWEAEGDIVDDTVRDTFVSHQAERLLGYPIREWTEQPTFWLDHIHPEDKQRVLRLRRAAIDARKDYHLDYRMIARDGRVVWLHSVVNVVVKDERRVKQRGICVDITSLKEAEAAIRESEERFRTLAETMPAALLIYRGDRWVYANPAAETVTGYSRDELLGMKVWDLLAPESQAIARQRAASRQRGEALTPRTELRLLTRSGREHWVEIIATPITFQGQPSVLVTGFDITERARAEAALRASEEALRQSHARIRDLAGKLMLTQEEERRRISRELHDDVNQKIAALAIAISRLRHRLPGSPESLREQLIELQDRTTALSNDVRQLSHQLHPAALEHTGLVSALKTHCTEFSNLEGISVALTIQGATDAIPLDMAICLYRVTQESLRNIAKHADTREARVTLAAVDDVVRLCIADTGAGFDPRDVKQKGGLGLVSIEERVRLLRGKLRIRTRPDGGTELEVQLPLDRA